MDTYTLRAALGRIAVSRAEDDWWGFVHRLMESEGLFSYFEQADDGKSHTLVITDNLDSVPALGPQAVPFCLVARIANPTHWCSGPACERCKARCWPPEPLTTSHRVHPPIPMEHLSPRPLRNAICHSKLKYAKPRCLYLR